MIYYSWLTAVFIMESKGRQQGGREGERRTEGDETEREREKWFHLRGLWGVERGKKNVRE
jgi:hypothetical protein